MSDNLCKSYGEFYLQRTDICAANPPVATSQARAPPFGGSRSAVGVFPEPILAKKTGAYFEPVTEGCIVKALGYRQNYSDS